MLWLGALWLGLWVPAGSGGLRRGPGAGGCEPISIAMCQGIGYNRTRLPNLLGHWDQGEAALQLQAFAPLVAYGCDPRLRFLLCSLFAPMCTEQLPRAIPACRPMCEAARGRCAPVLALFHFAWPPALDCQRLPTSNDPQALCMEDPQDQDQGDHLPAASSSPEAPRGQGMLPLEPPPRPSSPSSAPPAHDCPEGPKFVFVAQRGRCVARCGGGVDLLWSAGDKALALGWMWGWSWLCFASTAFTGLTFLLDPGRFRYPERPIVFLSLCSNLYAAAFLLRGFAGAERIACAKEEHEEGHPEEGHQEGHQAYYWIRSGPESVPCALAFLLLYYSLMAGSAWWLVLTLAWFLAAGKKWGREAIEARSAYFHLGAWGLPALQALAALALRQVAAEELTGLCFVAPEPAALAAFVLLPLGAYLAAGSAFLLRGFAALFRIRRALKQRLGGSGARGLERLMLRLGLFSVLYTVPAAAVLACFAYEGAHLEAWALRALRSPCRPPRDPREPQDCSLRSSIPPPALVLLRIFMALAVGIASGAWVWSGKTLHSWHRLLCRNKVKKEEGGNGETPKAAPQGPPRPPSAPSSPDGRSHPTLRPKRPRRRGHKGVFLERSPKGELGTAFPQKPEGPLPFYLRL
ncbi:frizzled-9-like [Sceloporus undulatus]|uniref:frizzled-9-like n=1 Tax=Sceloporus undulatus TaxID=8520 RepID=UPI001C4C23FB|nr:frizzled-9-like [Sceloporus undulatus]